MFCKQCGKQLKDNSSTCSCGTRVGKGGRYCEHCGTKIQNGSCPQCSSQNTSDTLSDKLPNLSAESTEDVVQSPLLQKLGSVGKRSNNQVNMYSNYSKEDNPLGKKPFSQASFQNPIPNKTPRSNSSNKTDNSDNLSNNSLNNDSSDEILENFKDISKDIPEKTLDKMQEKGESQEKYKKKTMDDVSLFGLSGMLLSLGYVFTSSLLFLGAGFVMSILGILQRDFKLSGATIIMLGVTAANIFLL